MSGRNRTLALRTRLVAFAIVLATLALGANGASWMIEHPAANELVMAQSVLDRITGPDSPAQPACDTTRPDSKQAL